MVAAICDYSNNHWSVHFNWWIVSYVNYTSVKLLKNDKERERGGWKHLRLKAAHQNPSSVLTRVISGIHWSQPSLGPHFYLVHFQGPNHSSPTIALWSLLLCMWGGGAGVGNDQLNHIKSPCPSHIHSFNTKLAFIECPLCAKHSAYVIFKPHYNPRR